MNDAKPWDTGSRGSSLHLSSRHSLMSSEAEHDSTDESDLDSCRGSCKDDSSADSSRVVNRIRTALTDFVHLRNHDGPKKSQKLAKKLLSLLEDPTPSTPSPARVGDGNIPESTVSSPKHEDPSSQLPASETTGPNMQVFDLHMNAKRKGPRKPYTKEKRKETHETRKRGACSRCRKQKKRCLEGHHTEVKAPSKGTPCFLQPKPPSSENDEIISSLPTGLPEASPVPAPSSRAGIQDIKTTTIHAPIPARQLPISFDIFNGHRLIPQTDFHEGGPSIPRRMTPEYPPISVSLLRKRPSLQNIYSAPQDPQRWSNYCRSYGSGKGLDLDGFNFDEFLASRGLGAQDSSSPFDQISPLMLASDGLSVPHSPRSDPVVGHPDNLKYVDYLNGQSNPSITHANECVSFEPDFSTLAGLDNHSLATSIQIPPLDTPDQPPILEQDHPQQSSCANIDCACQAIPGGAFETCLQAIVPNNLSPTDLPSGGRHTQTPRLQRSYSASNIFMPPGFLSATYPMPSNAPATPFPGDLISFDPTLMDFSFTASSSTSLSYLSRNTTIKDPLSDELFQF